MSAINTTGLHVLAQVSEISPSSSSIPLSIQTIRTILVPGLRKGIRNRGYDLSALQENVHYAQGATNRIDKACKTAKTALDGIQELYERAQKKLQDCNIHIAPKSHKLEVMKKQLSELLDAISPSQNESNDFTALNSERVSPGLTRVTLPAELVRATVVPKIESDIQQLEQELVPLQEALTHASEDCSKYQTTHNNSLREYETLRLKHTKALESEQTIKKECETQMTSVQADIQVKEMELAIALEKLSSNARSSLSQSVSIDEEMESETSSKRPRSPLEESDDDLLIAQASKQARTEAFKGHPIMGEIFKKGTIVYYNSKEAAITDYNLENDQFQITFVEEGQSIWVKDERSLCLVPKKNQEYLIRETSKQDKEERYYKAKIIKDPTIAKSSSFVHVKVRWLDYGRDAKRQLRFRDILPISLQEAKEKLESVDVVDGDRIVGTGFYLKPKVSASSSTPT